MANSIGSLTLNLTAKTAAWSAGLAKASGSLSSFAASISSAKAKVLGWGTAALTAVAGGGLIYLAKQTAETMDQMAKFADRTGLSTEALAGLRHGAALAGISAEELNGGLTKMLKTLGQAANGSAEAQGSLRALGLDVKDLITLPADKQIGLIADAIAKIPNAAQQSAAAISIFGRSGANLLPLLRDGSVGIAAMRAEADKLGLTFGRVDAAKIEIANDSLIRVKETISGALQTAVIEIAPFIDAAATSFVNWATAGEGMGAKVQSAIETVLVGTAKVADWLELLKAGFYGVQTMATVTLGLIVKGLDGLARTGQWAWNMLTAGVQTAAAAMVDALQWLATKVEKLLNLLPGVNVKLSDSLTGMGDALREQAKKSIEEAGKAWTDDSALKQLGDNLEQAAGESWGKLKEAISAFSEGKNSKAVEDWIAKTRAANQKAAQAIADKSKTGPAALASQSAKVGQFEQVNLSRIAIGNGAGATVAKQPIQADDRELSLLTQIRDRLFSGVQAVTT